ncbi:MAG: DEAD/DEAH box helicase [Desulfovibrio sp.]|nr:DEAD/DEAH box helicase [Desulfovibrio sp.]
MDEDIFSHKTMTHEDSKRFLLADALCPYLNNAQVAKVLNTIQGWGTTWSAYAVETARQGFTKQELYTSDDLLSPQYRHTLCCCAEQHPAVVKALCTTLGVEEKTSKTPLSWAFLQLYVRPDSPIKAFTSDQVPPLSQSVYNNLLSTYLPSLSFDWAWFQMLPAPYKACAARLCLDAFMYDTQLWTSTDVILRFCETADSLEKHTAQLYAVTRMFQGKPWLCASTKSLSTMQESLDGCQCFINGDFEGGYERLTAVAQKWSKAKGFKNFVYYPGFLGLVLFLCRFRAKINNSTLDSDCDTLLASVKGMEEETGYLFLKQLIACKYQSSLFHNTNAPYYPEVWNSLFTRIIHFLACLGQKMSKTTWVECCTAYRDQFRPFFPMLYNILNDILREEGSSKEENIAGIPYTSWVDMAKPLARWEKQFESLQELFGKETHPKTEDKQRRLAWFIDFSSKSVAPYIQVMLQGGRWSSGKRVTIRHLMEEHESWITPQDFDVIRCYRQEVRSFGRVENIFDRENAFLALVDHPYLFSFEREPIKLVKGDMELNVREENEQCRITLSAATDNEDDTIAFKEIEKGVWAVYVLDAITLRLTSILGNEGMDLPVAELPTFLNMVQQVKSLKLNVQAKVPHKPGDPIPVVQLWQQGMQYFASLRVRPSGGKEGTTYLPGGGKQEVIQVSEGQTAIFDRNFSKEMEHLQHLLALCPSLTNIDDNWDWGSDELDDFFYLITELQDANNESEVCHVEWPKGERFKLAGKITKTQIAIHTRQSGEWFALSGEAKINELKVMELTELLERSNGKSPFVQLKNGEFLTLSDDVRRSLERLRLLTARRNAKERMVHPLAGSLVEEIVADMPHDSDIKWDAMIKRMKSAFSLKPDVPTSLRADLRPYQMTGFVWLARLAEWGVGACLADDMGLGKTVQAIAVMLREVQKGPCLIIAPTSVCPNWIDELHRFAPTLQVVRLKDAIDRKAMVDEMQAGMVMVTGYGLLPRENELLATKEWQMVVFDEAQALKNSHTQRSRAAHQLNAHFPVALTGTPIENHLEDLWSVFNIINPGLLGNLNDFHRRFGDASEGGPSAAALKMLIRPFILRRLKSQVLDDLPELTEQTIIIEPTEKEAAFYESLRRMAVERVSEGPTAKGQRRFCILTELMRLRRACCHASLADPAVAAEAVEPISSKLTRFLELLDEARSGGHKLLVFSQFTGHLALVRAELDKRKIRYQYLDGSTPEEQRRQSVAAFQRGEGDCFLISLKAGGQGLNLTAADIVVHLDPWWNPAVEDQATDRAHRIGQKNTVTVYRLVMAHSVEEKILQLHARKRDLAADFLEGSEEAVTAATLSEEDLLKLLE